MNEDLQLGYLVLDTPDKEQLDSTFTNVLGLIPQQLSDGVTAYQMDDWDRRFVLRSAGEDGVGAIGLVARDATIYGKLLDRLRSNGVSLTSGSDDECRVRGVRELVRFQDPAGTRVELAVAPLKARTPGFSSPLVPGGFVTGSLGLGHVVLLAADRAASVDFYVGCLGFEVSDTSEDETPDGLAEATFLHCNPRHHTIAIAKRLSATNPSRVLGHFMIQANEIDAVGMAYDRALDANLTIFRSLGRHPNDQMFSFYGRTTSNFDVEFGAGAVDIGADWQVRHYRQFSAWGHRPGPGMPCHTRHR